MKKHTLPDVQVRINMVRDRIARLKIQIRFASSARGRDVYREELRAASRDLDALTNANQC